MACQVADLAEYQDLRMIVRANIRSFLRHGTAKHRGAMIEVVTTVMRKYGKRKMSFGSYEVILERDGGFSFPLIRAKRVSKRCPKCGREKGLLYISTQKQNLFGPRDLVTWGCRDCGEVFNRWEVNGDDAG
jgi:hypothetical protein